MYTPQRAYAFEIATLEVRLFLELMRLLRGTVGCSFGYSTGQEAGALEAGDLAANQVLPLLNPDLDPVA